MSFRYGDTAGMAASISMMAATHNSPTSGPASSELDAARQRIGRQELLIQTLIGVLLEKGLCTKEEFLELLDAVDMLDGKRDGKLADASNGVECGSCGTKNVSGKPTCVWCGKPLPESANFVRHNPGSS